MRRAEPAATSDHPLISARLMRYPYHMTTYHEDDIASVDSSFGVQVHHPRFLECMGVLELVRLLGCPPAEWLQVMDRRDSLYAALQLQRDAGLMSSNLMVLHQFAIALHRMSTEVLHSMFGWEYFPLGAVDDAAPVPRVLWASTQMAAMGSLASTGRFRAGYHTSGCGLPRLSQVSSAAVQLAVRTGLPAPVYAGFRS